ncbi:MAG: MFS transporter [Planctomycetes bacterium]|jgi:MFS family permease|nr:MFS transporter [Planctomycetota bacterium]HPY76065.1 MFS transporter [Planctomycetota bacterium]
MNSKNRISPAIVVIIIFGIISMLGDIVYESARSANSQYLNWLGISAAKVGLVFGIGEFLGYALRLLAGIMSDKSGKPWFFMFIGYGMLLSVPLMGFTMEWNLLVIFILMERIGKALRNPAKDTVLSGVAEDQVGIGFAFGLQEALDQLGAFLGPLVFTAVFYFAGNSRISEYQLGYKLLIVPFVILMIFLYFAFKKITSSKLLSKDKNKNYEHEKLEPVFWYYTVFAFFCTMGFVNFSIIGYHLKANQLMSDGNITLLYSFAMLIDAVAAIIVGKAYDRLKEKTKKKTGGILVLAVIPLMTMLLPLLTLSNSTTFIIMGMLFFGIIMGMHETIMRSAIADITPYRKRGTGYGIFNSAYGLAFLAGSALMGLLYDMQLIKLIIAFTFITEIIAIVLYLMMNNTIKSDHQYSA